MQSSGLFNVLGFRGRLGGLSIFGSSPLEIPTRKVIINRYSITDHYQAMFSFWGK